MLLYGFPPGVGATGYGRPPQRTQIAGAACWSSCRLQGYDLGPASGQSGIERGGHNLMRCACRKTNAASAPVLPALRKREHCMPVPAGYVYPSASYIGKDKRNTSLVLWHSAGELRLH